MGFLAKIGSGVRNLFTPRKQALVPKLRKRRPGVDWDTPQHDWRDELGPEGFKKHGSGGQGWGLLTVDLSDWNTLISSNVERIRYGPEDEALQVIFKNGSLYQYEDVEPEVFLSFLRAPSPGQFVWYVLRQGGYAYAKLWGDEETSGPAADRFSGQPFAIPKEVRSVWSKSGRKLAQGGLWNHGIPTAKGAKAPPLPFH